MTVRVFTGGIDARGRRIDIHVESGVVTAILPSSDDSGLSQAEIDVVDLAGLLVLPGFVEPHAHLDKALLAERVDNPTGDLMGAIGALETIRDTLTADDICERAMRAARLLSVNGVTKIRTHADTTVSGGLASVLGLLEASRRCAGFIDIEVAALVEWPLTGNQGAERRALARDAVQAGVHVLGGCPHLDPDPEGAVDVLIDLALEAGLPLDLHADENLRAESDDLFFLARRILSDGLTMSANASHCVSLSMKELSRQREIADMCAQAQVSVTALPHTNLFLQGREAHVGVPRGITPVDILREAGVTVAAGGDNLQDPFNPVGRGDPLETASLLVMAAHQSPDGALDCISTGSARVVGLDLGLDVGKRASFVALGATSVREAIAMGPPDRLVVHGGVVIDEQNRNTK